VFHCKSFYMYTPIQKLVICMAMEDEKIFFRQVNTLVDPMGLFILELRLLNSGKIMKVFKHKEA